MKVEFSSCPVFVAKDSLDGANRDSFPIKHRSTKMPECMKPKIWNISRFVFLYIFAMSISNRGERVALLYESFMCFINAFPYMSGEDYWASCNPGIYTFFSIMLMILATINTMIV